MSLLKYRRFISEDFKDAPAWWGRFLYSLNVILDTIFEALNGGLTLEESLGADVREIEIKAGASATANAIRLKTKVQRPSFAILGRVQQISGAYAPLTSAPYISYKTDAGESGTIFIDAIGGLTAGVTYKIKVVIF